MYQRIGAQAFKKDLKNIKLLSKALGNPQSQFKSIHIAGTNGKGSVSHFIASVLIENKLKVGIYTSPHYLDFRERIKIGNDFISKKEVIDFVNTNKQAIKKINPSFFEITVALAFDHFARHQVDIAIIETGLGGRLDSTNIITPLLSVITNIGLDHQNMLGNSLSKIAKEKAGIIKKHTPVLIGERQVGIQNVFKKRAQQLESSIFYAKNIIAKNQYKALSQQFPANYQSKNINTAINAIKILYPKLSTKTIFNGISKVHQNSYFIGRWQWLSKNPLILVDSAHNQDGLTLILNQLKSKKYPRIHFVLGFVNDKSLDDILRLFPFDSSYYFAKANVPRGLNAKVLKLKAAKYGLKGKHYSSVRKALAAAKSRIQKNELIYVGGSIFVVAETV